MSFVKCALGEDCHSSSHLVVICLAFAAVTAALLWGISLESMVHLSDSVVEYLLLLSSLPSLLLHFHLFLYVLGFTLLWSPVTTIFSSTSPAARRILLVNDSLNLFFVSWLLKAWLASPAECKSLSVLEFHRWCPGQGWLSLAYFQRWYSEYLILDEGTKILPHLGWTFWIAMQLLQYLLYILSHQRRSFLLTLAASWAFPLHCLCWKQAACLWYDKLRKS